MPHFSPILWLACGFVFYIILCSYMVLLWWNQNFSFNMIEKSSCGNKNFNWDWF